MLRGFNPTSVAAPAAHYCHGVEVPAGARMVICSGQVGQAKDGSVPPDAEGQTAICFENVKAILADAGMGFEDIVKVGYYITGTEHLAGLKKARDKYMGSLPPKASTLLVIAALARPQFFIEIEVVAAKKD